MRAGKQLELEKFEEEAERKKGGFGVYVIKETRILSFCTYIASGEG